jgi:hypothetical protein
MKEMQERAQRVWEKIKNPVLVIVAIGLIIWFILFSPCH